jgi:hypothetical protein
MIQHFAIVIFIFIILKQKERNGGKRSREFLFFINYYY